MPLNPSQLLLHGVKLFETRFQKLKLTVMRYLMCVKIRNLGIIFNEKLTWNDHVDEMCKKICFGLRKLWTCSHFTPTEIRRRLILALILPLFTYGDVFFSLSLNSACQHRLNVLFNSCARYVFGIKRYEHISSFTNYWVLSTTILQN